MIYSHAADTAYEMKVGEMFFVSETRLGIYLQGVIISVTHTHSVRIKMDRCVNTDTPTA